MRSLSRAFRRASRWTASAATSSPCSNATVTALSFCRAGWPRPRSVCAGERTTCSSAGSACLPACVGEIPAQGRRVHEGVAFRRVKVRVSALARRSSGCFIEQFSRHCGGATFAARLRELSAFGSRQAPWHESPPSRCTKTPTAWASLKGGVHLFVSFRVLRRQVFVTRCN